MASEIEIRIPEFARHSAGRERKVPWVWIVIIVLYLALAGLYITVTPLFEAPGELYAARYSTHLAATGRMPEVVIVDKWWQVTDAHQPPLYYAIGSLFMRGVDPALFDSLLYNPHLTTGLAADSSNNKNALIHPLPLQARDILAPRVYLLRILSVIFSLGFLLVSYSVSRLLVPAQTGLQQAALAVTALNPLFIVASTAASGTSLSCLWFALVLYVYLAVDYRQRFGWQWFLLLGVLVGAAAITTLAGLALLLILPAAALLLAWQDGTAHRRSRFGLFAVALCAALAVSGWWYVRNWVLYGWLVLPQLSDSLVFSQVSLSSGRLGESIATYWGLFGWGNITAERAYYAIVGILGALGVLGLVLEIARIYWEQSSRRVTDWRGWGAAAIWSGVFGLQVLLLPGLMQPSIMMLLALSPLLSIVIPVGLRSWFVVRRRDLLIWLMPVILAVMAVLAPFRYILPTYRVPEPLTLADVPPSIRNINLRYGTELFLLGYELPESHTKVGDVLKLRLYWLAQQKPNANYTVSIRIQGREQVQVGAIDTYPEGGKRATGSFVPGEVISEEYLVPIDANAQAPTAAQIRVGVLNSDTGVFLSVSTPLGQPLEDMPVIARVAIMPIEHDANSPQIRMNLVLGNKIELIGYSLSPDIPQPGDQWQVTLFWRPVVPLAQDYTVFVHLFNETGEKIAQVDEQPVNNHYPTSLWRSQEVIEDIHLLKIPADLSTTSLEIRLGLYLLDTGERLLPVPSPEGQTEVIIGPFYLQEK